MDASDKWGPFSIQAILQACQVFLHYFHRVKDKMLSYSACFGNATKSLVFLHSPSQVQFASTLTWPEVNDCSRITSFQSKYIPATQQGLLIQMQHFLTTTTCLLVDCAHLIFAEPQSGSLTSKDTFISVINPSHYKAATPH